MSKVETKTLVETLELSRNLTNYYLKKARKSVIIYHFDQMNCFNYKYAGLKPYSVLTSSSQALSFNFICSVDSIKI